MKSYFYLVGFKPHHCVLKGQTLPTQSSGKTGFLGMWMCEQLEEKIGCMHCAHCFSLVAESCLYVMAFVRLKAND